MTQSNTTTQMTRVKGYRVKDGREESKGNLPIQKRGRYKKINAPLHHHSTVTEYGCGYAHLISNSDVFFSFDLTTRSTSLNNQNYNEYQQFLYDTISGLLLKGMNYKEIADWLNDNGYKTLRGKKFRNNHTHSIMKKRKLSNERFSETYPTEFSNCSLEVYDKSILNQVM